MSAFAEALSGNLTGVGISPRSDAAAMAGRAAHNLGLAALLGGNLFGRLAMHPALEHVSAKTERGEVVNAAWRRYGTVNSLSLAAVVGGWLLARGDETSGGNLSAREEVLARAKDVAVAAVAATGIASAATGVRFSHSAPGGAVPLESGSEPAAETPPGAARAKRLLNVLGGANTLAEAALVAIDAALAQESFRRPAARRFLRPRR